MVFEKKKLLLDVKIVRNTQIHCVEKRAGIEITKSGGKHRSHLNWKRINVPRDTRVTHVLPYVQRFLSKNTVREN